LPELSSGDKRIPTVHTGVCSHFRLGSVDPHHHERRVPRYDELHRQRNTRSASRPTRKANYPATPALTGLAPRSSLYTGSFCFAGTRRPLCPFLRKQLRGCLISWLPQTGRLLRDEIVGIDAKASARYRVSWVQKDIRMPAGLPRMSSGRSPRALPCRAARGNAAQSSVTSSVNRTRATCSRRDSRMARTA
jgi:hypothetical protein